MDEGMSREFLDLIEIMQFVERVSARIHGLTDEGEILRVLEEEFRRSGRYSLHARDEALHPDRLHRRPYLLVIANIVLHQYLIPLSERHEVPLLGASLLPHILDIDYYRSILFWASIMEALFGGLVAGKIEDGSMKAGLRHSVTLLSITVLLFNLLAT